MRSPTANGVDDLVYPLASGENVGCHQRPAMTTPSETILCSLVLARHVLADDVDIVETAFPDGDVTPERPRGSS
jgi:hypothetical protein